MQFANGKLRNATHRKEKPFYFIERNGNKKSKHQTVNDRVSITIIWKIALFNVTLLMRIEL